MWGHLFNSRELQREPRGTCFTRAAPVSGPGERVEHELEGPVAAAHHDGHAVEVEPDEDDAQQMADRAPTNPQQSPDDRGRANELVLLDDPLALVADEDVARLAFLRLGLGIEREDHRDQE